MAAWDQNINILELMAHGFSAHLNVGRVVVGDSSTPTQNGQLTLDHLHKQSLLLCTYNGEDVWPNFNLDESFLDPRYNFKYPSSGEFEGDFRRGDEAFQRPYGWLRLALRVRGKYEDDKWLGVNRPTGTERASADGEWAVSYRGTKRNRVDSVIKDGFSLKDGIYSTPSPSAAEKYSEAFEYNGEMYKMMFINRVNMNNTHIFGSSEETRYITSDENAIRPYAILYKKIDTLYSRQ